MTPAAAHRAAGFMWRFQWRFPGWAVVAIAAALTLLGAPTAHAGMPSAPLDTPGMPSADTLPQDLTLTAVTPPVATATTGVTVTGTIRSTRGATYVDPEIHIVRPKAGIVTRDDVTRWAAATDPVTNGTELARATIPAQVGPDAPATFTMTLSPTALRLTRSSGVVPIDIQLVTRAGVQASLHTFIGWQRSPEATALSISWLVPLTLDPDPQVHAASADTRAPAWARAVGPNSRIARLLAATADTTTGYAVDPALLGPTLPSADPAASSTSRATTNSTGTVADNTADTARARVKDSLAAQRNALVGEEEIASRRGLADALATAAATHPVWALPRGDLDLTALFDSGVDLATPTIARWLTELTAPAPLLTAVVQSGTGSASVLTHVAWPLDGRLPVGREAQVHTAYGQWGPDVLLVSTHETNVDPDVTPHAAARTPQGLPVLRWDDPLGEIASRVHSSADVALAGQEFLAQTATLWAQAPQQARSMVVALPRDFDTDPAAFTAFRQLTDSSPFATVGRIGDALDSARAANSEFVDPEPPSAATPPTPIGPAVLDAGLIQRLAGERATVAGYLGLMTTPSTALIRWWDLVDEIAGVRWRAQPSSHAGLVTALESGVATLEGSLVIAEQTTNFLADEGVLLVTVVNDLDVPVDGIQVNLAPTNPRMHVVEPATPLRIGAHSKATARVRLAASAQGLVPIDAWLSDGTGQRIGPTTRITVRAAPPGVWLYVVGGVIVGALVLAGAIQALRRPRRELPGVVLDPIQPTPEEPVSVPIDHLDGHDSPPSSPASHPASRAPDA